MSQSIKTQIVIITAGEAKKLLGNNTHNRSISKGNIETIKTSLLRGEWKLNGEAIKIAKDGKILDGQHRLLACAETGISFKTLLVTGLENETQDTMDSGKSRSHADVLSLAGYKNAHALSALVTATIRAEQWHLRAAFLSTGAYPVTRKQVLDHVEASGQYLQDLVRTSIRFNKIGLAATSAALLKHTFSSLGEDGPQDADHFFEKLLVGDGLEKGSPILALRNELMKLRDAKGTRDKVYIAAITIKAWNKFRAGEQAMFIRFTPGGANPEKFPEPK